MNNSANSIPNNRAATEKTNHFPWKLYDMLHTAEKRNEEHIISWIRDGKAFKVHKRDQFIEEYMKKIFNQTKFKSFQRQLNLWGFQRVQIGPDKGSYFHPLFVRGRRDCCQHLSRAKLKGTAEKLTHAGILEKQEPQNSPYSMATTTAESLSTTGAAILPLAVATPSIVEGNCNTVSPASLLGAFVNFSRPASATAIEHTVQGHSLQTQLSEFLHYHTSERRKEIIRKAAISLSPELSVTVVGSPVFAIATDTSKQNPRSEYQQKYHNDYTHEQQEKQSRIPPRQPKIEVSTGDHQQKDEKESLNFQQGRTKFDRQSKIECQGQKSRKRVTSSGLEALLAVTAQRRREEEMALLLGIPDGEDTPRTK
ncbi:unnamed protein product [Pseudo-nitzschia multistriata]|uniref:HSF-type DNA-binding domain-containing protein n=1 Tax=Pseudo-nitzschia multistriata TaxID=183589 RepID=A0A448ZSZ7_9STRA|nr:unnamed protein product [Pseudo-nitzschia multistriata]